MTVLRGTEVTRKHFKISAVPRGFPSIALAGLANNRHQKRSGRLGTTSPHIHNWVLVGRHPADNLVNFPLFRKTSSTSTM
eukprot:6487638-Amphidinium_carterae.1